MVKPIPEAVATWLGVMNPPHPIRPLITKLVAVKPWLCRIGTAAVKKAAEPSSKVRTIGRDGRPPWVPAATPAPGSEMTREPGSARDRLWARNIGGGGDTP